ncbi:MAG: hypothetical protein ACYC0V_20815 [Armatimonadota bacterium]
MATSDWLARSQPLLPSGEKIEMRGETFAHHPTLRIQSSPPSDVIPGADPESRKVA